MNRPQILPVGPLSRRFDAAAVRDGSATFRVEATPAECAAVAADCDLPGIDALAADLRIVREGEAGLRVTGRVTARVRQICVVSLDEFASEVDEPVDVPFAPEADVEALVALHAARPATQDDEAAADLPDPIVNGRIDLGALTAEMLALALDPYPRKPGVAFADPAPPEPDEPAASPFAALRGLKGPGEA